MFINLAGRTGMEEKYLQIARNANKMQKTIPDYVPFPCNVTGRGILKSLLFFYFPINNYLSS